MRILRGSRGIGVVVIVAVSSLVSAGSALSADDVTPPTVSVITPAQGATYAQNSVVKANYSCSDASGIAACVGTVANGANIPTQKLGTRSFTVWGYDNAGNKTKVERTYNVVDKTAPQITISKPANGATYAKNSAVFAQYACHDTGSGIASCVGTVPNGSNLPTGTSGDKSFKVTAKDAAGNVASKTVFYKVA